MNLRDYYFSLPREERDAFARRAGYSPSYLWQRLFPRSGPPTRSPRLAGVLNLAAATDGAVSEHEALAYFRVSAVGTPGDKTSSALDAAA